MDATHRRVVLVQRGEIAPAKLPRRKAGPSLGEEPSRHVDTDRRHSPAAQKVHAVTGSATKVEHNPGIVPDQLDERVDPRVSINVIDQISEEELCVALCKRVVRLRDLLRHRRSLTRTCRVERGCLETETARGSAAAGPNLERAPAMRFTIHPELPATDIERAKAWYRDKLGLEPVDAEPGDEELLYDTGTAKFGVYQSRHAGANLATAARLVTDDFDRIHAELRGRGVTFEWYPIEGNFHEDDGQPYWEDGALVSPDGEKTAWFKDSEGNILALGTSD